VNRSATIQSDIAGFATAPSVVENNAMLDPKRQARFAGNPEHLAVMRRTLADRSAVRWNEWRRTNPALSPDLRGISLVDGVFALSGANLSQTDLSEAELNNAILDGANLAEANLYGSRLARASFRGVTLDGTNLSKADLFGASLRAASLRKAHVWGANLIKADLEGAHLEGADFFESIMNEAVLAQSCADGVSLKEAQLWGANLRGACLNNAVLTGTNLVGAILEQSHLRGARLTGSNLLHAKCAGANLDGADLSETNLTGADFSGANLRGVALQHAQLVGTSFEDADMSNARVYGVSVWDTKINDRTKQQSLIITPPTVASVLVDDLEVAQFIYLLLEREKIRQVISTMASKGVLILGRFTPERKAVLDAMAARLRQLGFLPMIFDFERAASRDFTETVKTLAGLSLFVVADITKPKSVPLELQATVPDYQIPFAPIIQDGEAPFGMFIDLQNKYRTWVLPLVVYKGEADLMENFDQLIVARVRCMLEEIVRLKSRQLEVVYTDALKPDR
jgi:uncharacterized protein YjbI with pentapeptide repeats